MKPKSQNLQQYQTVFEIEFTHSLLKLILSKEPANLQK